MIFWVCSWIPFTSILLSTICLHHKGYPICFSHKLLSPSHNSIPCPLLSACGKWEISREAPRSAAGKALLLSHFLKHSCFPFGFFFLWKPERYIHSAKLFSQYLLIKDVLCDKHCNFWVNSTEWKTGPFLPPMGGKPQQSVPWRIVGHPRTLSSPSLPIQNLAHDQRIGTIPSCWTSPWCDTGRQTC